MTRYARCGMHQPVTVSKIQTLSFASVVCPKLVQKTEHANFEFLVISDYDHHQSIENTVTSI